MRIAMEHGTPVDKKSGNEGTLKVRWDDKIDRNSSEPEPGREETPENVAPRTRDDGLDVDPSPQKGSKDEPTTPKETPGRVKEGLGADSTFPSPSPLGPTEPTAKAASVKGNAPEKKSPRDLMAEYLAHANRLAKEKEFPTKSASSPESRPLSFIEDLQQLTQKLAAIATALETLDRVLHESLEAIEHSQGLTKEPFRGPDSSILTGDSRQELLEMMARRLRN